MLNKLLRFLELGITLKMAQNSENKVVTTDPLNNFSIQQSQNNIMVNSEIKVVDKKKIASERQKKSRINKQLIHEKLIIDNRMLEQKNKDIEEKLRISEENRSKMLGAFQYYVNMKPPVVYIQPNEELMARINSENAQLIKNICSETVGTSSCNTSKLVNNILSTEFG